MPQISTDLAGHLPTRAASVVEALRAAVLSGEYQAGEHLHELRLTARLGVSRTPVRAALQTLASEGLLDYAPNRGYAVREFPVAEIVNAYEVRAVLEGLAVRLVAQAGLLPEAREVLQAALAEGDDLVAAPDFGDEHRSAYAAVNVAFHETIHAAAGSRLLGDMIRLCQQVPVSSPRNVIAFEQRDVRRRHEDHHRIFEAIVEREPWRAEMRMRDHVASVRTSLVRSLLVRPAPAGPGD
jgi:GntR family transcriptional regulator of vanillate catabolism